MVYNEKIVSIKFYIKDIKLLDNKDRNRTECQKYCKIRCRILRILKTKLTIKIKYRLIEVDGN